MKKLNIVQAENALPKEIKIERICEGAGIPQCYWAIKIKTWDKKTFEGLISDYQVMGMLKRYKPYNKYPKYIFKEQYEKNS